MSSLSNASAEEIMFKKLKQRLEQDTSVSGKETVPAEERDDSTAIAATGYNRTVAVAGNYG